MKTIFVTVFYSLSVLAFYGQHCDMGMPYNSTEKPNIINSVRNTMIISEAEIIHRIPAPTQYIAGIVYDGQNIFAEGYNEFEIFCISPVDGSIIYTVPISAQKPTGLAYDGTDLYLLDNLNKKIEKLNKTTGFVLDSFSIDYGGQTYPTGMVYINGEIWYNDPIGPYTSYANDKTFNISLSGSLLQSFDAKGDYPTGMTFDGQYLWTSDNFERLIHQVDLNTFEIVKTIEAPGGAYPNGLAWDGNYLWVSNNETDSIYQLDVGNTTNISSFESDAITVFPNPASSQIHIDISGNINTPSDILIYNVHGTLVKEARITNNHFVWDLYNETEKIKPGYYLYRIVSKELMETGSFCIITN